MGIQNKMNKAIERDSRGVPHVVDESIDGTKAIPIVMVTKDENGTFKYVEEGAGGKDGKSAYEIAVDNGFEGDQTEWIESLKGNPGDKGEPFKYENFTEEQLEDLIGPKGNPGERGTDGTDGKDGIDGKDGENGKDGKDADPQFTEEQVAALLSLIEED